MEEPFRSIRFGRLFLFQGLNFSVGHGWPKSRLRDMWRGVADIFSVHPGEFHGGQKVPSGLFRKASGQREGAVASCRRPVLQPSRFSYHTSIWTSVRTCDTPGNPCSTVPQGAGGLRHIFEHGWPRSQPDPLLSGVASMKRFFTFACLGVAGVMMMRQRSGLGRFQHLYHEGRRQ